jgi:hypothetical protein
MEANVNNWKLAENMRILVLKRYEQKKGYVLYFNWSVFVSLGGQKRITPTLSEVWKSSHFI